MGRPSKLCGDFKGFGNPKAPCLFFAAPNVADAQRMGNFGALHEFKLLLPWPFDAQPIVQVGGLENATCMQHVRIKVDCCYSEPCMTKFNRFSQFICLIVGGGYWMGCGTALS